MASGYKFPILNSGGSASSTVVDFEDMFVSKNQFINAGLWSFGYGAKGELGLSSGTNRSSPTQVGTLTNWKVISAGSYHSAAIKTDGTLWVWGHNGFGQLGLLDIVHRSSPVQVGTSNNWKLVTCGGYTTAGIMGDGTLWTWGYNVDGMLGLNDIVHRSSPVQVGSLTTWKKIYSSGYFSGGLMSAIKVDNTLWTWGTNTYGQLGLNDIVHRSSPVQVGSLTSWKSAQCGGIGRIIALRGDGTLWTMGANSRGELGLNDTTHRSSPVQVGSLTSWKQAISGGNQCLAIADNGTLWAWGQNQYGQLGLLDVAHRSSPTQVGSLTSWKQVGKGGTYHSGAVMTDGTLWMFGNNTNGQLGLNDIVHRSSPVQVGSFVVWKEVTCGGERFSADHTLAIQSSDFYTY